MKGILYKSKEGWMVKYTTYKTIPGIKGVMGSHSRMPESNYLPVHPDTKLYPDGLWGQANVDEFETVDFEIVEVITPVEDGTTMFKCAKLVNEEKHTKRRRKKFSNIMEHNNIERFYTEEDMLAASKYGYEFRDTTSFPEHKFEDSCINNTKQWIHSLNNKTNMKSAEEIEYWVFSSYKNKNDYKNNQPFFEKEFTDFNKMKTFSANHSHLNKKVYPNYCSNYKKINSLNKQDNEN